MAGRPTASTLDFNAIGEPEVATDFAPVGTGAPVPAPILEAVRKSLRDGVALQFTVPASDPKHANVSTLCGFLRKAADQDKRGLSIRTVEVQNRAGNTTHVTVKFMTKAEKIQGRGRKPASPVTVTQTEAPAAS